MSKNIKAVLQYDGTNYHGFQIQSGQNLPTIQGTLEKVLRKILKEPIKIEASGRTDAGVHAKGQVINFFTNSKIPIERIPAALNSRLPKDIVITSAREVSSNFHARYDAVAKHYIYTIYNNPISSPFYRNYVYHIPYTLDWEKIQKACKILEGTHNFKSFASARASTTNYIRTIYSLEVIQKDNLYHFSIKGDGFLYNMVRIIVGTLLEIGKGKREIDSIKEALLGQSRKLTGKTAPPHGLCLQEVYYT